MIRGTDGLDYENLTEKLLGNPAKTERNWFILPLLAGGTSPRQEIFAMADHSEQRGGFYDIARSPVFYPCPIATPIEGHAPNYRGLASRRLPDRAPADEAEVRG